MPGTLYLVATPIGNLADMTYRAVETLRGVDVIACEDTRHTQKLLNHFRISARTVSYHEHNEKERAEQLVERIIAGESVAVVSDAGTPGICDPGSRLVRLAIDSGVSVVPIPGAAAFVSAVVASGLPTESIFFGGFLPSKKGERRKRLEELVSVPATLVFYETPHRIARSLADCLEILGDRRAAVARELTKLHEEVARGLLSELAGHFDAAQAKGEFVIAIDRGESGAAVDRSSPIVEVYQSFLDAGLDRKTALKKTAKQLALPRSEVYRAVEAGRDDR